MSRPINIVKTEAPLRKLILLFYANWYYFLAATIFTFFFAHFYLNQTFPTYRVSTKVLIEEGNDSGTPGIENLLEGFNVRPGAQNLDNQILILSSYKLIRNTLDELPFEIDYYRKGFFNSQSFYPLNPIDVEFNFKGRLPYSTIFTLHHEENHLYHLETTPKSDIQLDTIIRFGQMIDLGEGSITIRPHTELEEIYNSGDKIYFKFHNMESLAESYRTRLEVETASREGTIVNLSIEGTNKIKDVIFLDKLMEVFIFNNLEKKNQEARRIIAFIDEQLVDVSDSLMITENQLQEFRSKNMIMDVSAQAQQIIDQAVILENEKARMTLEANYYKYLEGYLSKDNNQEIPISPATMGIEDPLLANLMQELSGLQAEYFSSGVGERNPLQAQLELRINNTKQSLRETLQSIMLANQMAVDENTIQINKLNAQASRLPAKERQLLGIERKFNLNNVLYTYLLQRRAEAQIQKASNMPDNELIDMTRAESDPVKPDAKAVYFIALVLGLGIPYSGIYLSNIIRNKVSSEDDLKIITQLPIIGHVPHSRLSYNTVVLTESNSIIAEAFRSLRSRMDFLTKNAKCPLVLISSSIPGEGKTFSAINLASAYSLTGKKTLLIEFDLRRPAISKSFGIEGKFGLTSFLIGKSKMEDIIYKTDYQNLHVVPSGPIPPNPGELASSDNIRNLFQSFQEIYDLIVIDSAPIGTVSDSYSIAAYVDAVLILVRHGHTDKKVLETTLSNLQASGINNISLLVNGISSKRSSYQYTYNTRYDYKNRKVNGPKPKTNK